MVLDTELSGSEISFMTDRFSTYSVWYAETDVPTPPGGGDNPDTPENPDTPSNPDKPSNPNTPGNPDTPSNPNTPGNPDIPNNQNDPNKQNNINSNTTSVPQTGDDSNPALWITLMLASLTALAGLFAQKKKEWK